MSSPSRQDGGPPPDPPLQQPDAPSSPPQPSSSSSPDTPPLQQSATTASPSTPRTAGPAATGGTAPTTTSPPTGSGSSSRRPLSSISYFIPFTGGDGQATTTENGERIGLTWTLEVFTNDAEGMEAANASDDAEPNAGGDAAAPNATGGQAAGDGAPGAAANPGADAPAAPGAADQEPARRVVFVIGPDGRMLPRPGADPALVGAAAGIGAMAAAGFRAGGFLMPFPFAFHTPAAPAPDPAKAAELLASLPTVGRALLRRIDKIVTAEDEASGKEDEDRGWRCGICLDGIVAPPEASNEPSQEPTSQTVKALPCNHLFHEECLQPWFTSHHTCPTCRLDLDPLRTLHPPRQARGVRPPATGSGRETPTAHPYARGGGAARPARAASTVNGSETGAASRPGSQLSSRPGSRPATPTTDRAPPSILDGLRLFDTHQPMVASPVPMDRGELPQRSAQESRAEAAQPVAGPSTAAPSATPVAAPAAPTAPRLGVSASVPSSPQIGGPAHGDNSGPGLARPTPERRPHIHFFPFPFGNMAPTPTPPRAGSEPPANSATPPAPANVPRDQLHDFDEPRMRFPFDWLFMGAGGPPQPEEPAPAQTETPPPVTIERQSLESWTKEREKTLGWRCDGIECVVAPPVPENDDKDEGMAVDDESNEAIDADFTASDKEMLAIYASNQAPFNGEINIEEEQAHPHADYVLLACKHRWHRACLETAERSAGHTIKADAEGREWVRCGRCRKEGWVVPRHDEEPAASTTAPAPIAIDA